MSERTNEHQAEIRCITAQKEALETQLDLVMHYEPPEKRKQPNAVGIEFVSPSNGDIGEENLRDSSPYHFTENAKYIFIDFSCVMQFMRRTSAGRNVGYIFAPTLQRALGFLQWEMLQLVRHYVCANSFVCAHWTASIEGSQIPKTVRAQFDFISRNKNANFPSQFQSASKLQLLRIQTERQRFDLSISKRQECNVGSPTFWFNIRRKWWWSSRKWMIRLQMSSSSERRLLQMLVSIRNLEISSKASSISVNSAKSHSAAKVHWNGIWRKHTPMVFSAANIAPLASSLSEIWENTIEPNIQVHLTTMRNWSKFKLNFRKRSTFKDFHKSGIMHRTHVLERKYILSIDLSCSNQKRWLILQSECPLFRRNKRFIQCQFSLMSIHIFSIYASHPDCLQTNSNRYWIVTST